MHTKNCLICGKEIKVRACQKYCSLSCAGKSHPIWNQGKPLSESHRNNIHSGTIGRIHSEDHKNKIAKAHVNLHPTLITRKILSEKKLGKKLSASHRQHMREAIVRRIELRKVNNDLFTPRVGNQEKKIIDIFEKCLTYPVTRQYPILGYFIDGYFPALNLAIEVDEPLHFVNGVNTNILRQKDIVRQNEIEEKLQCTFVRIPVGY